MDKIISIIIPTYNRGKILKQCINSVFDQEEHPWELIIVDDGSSDGTVDLIRPYLTDERVHYIYQENNGVSAARNTGAAMASGEYLIFLDSDDIIYPQLLRRLHEISYFNYDLICWQVVKVIDGKKTIWKPTKLEKIYKGVIATFLAGSICYKKKAFEEVGGYDSHLYFGENYEMGLRISQKSDLKIKVVEETLAQYNLPPDRTSNSYSNRLASYLYLYEKHKEKYEMDPKSHSNLNYLLGYIHEQNGDFKKAKFYYLRSSKIYFRNYKAHLKRLYFKIFN